MLHNFENHAYFKMVIVKYFTLEKLEKAWFPRKNIEKCSKIYRSIINYSFHFYSVVKQ